MSTFMISHLARRARLAAAPEPARSVARSRHAAQRAPLPSVANRERRDPSAVAMRRIALTFPAAAAERRAVVAGAPASDDMLPGGWGQSFGHPLITDDAQLAELKSRYHLTAAMRSRSTKRVTPCASPCRLHWQRTRAPNSSAN